MTIATQMFEEVKQMQAKVRERELRLIVKRRGVSGDTC